MNSICLRDSVAIITGASRGIGKAIALRLAREGVWVAILAKTEKPHPKLPGTIHSAADEVRQVGGEVLPLAVDVRDEDRIKEAVAQVVAQWQRIDILVNNAGALGLTDTENTPMHRFDRMHAVNVRATFACSQACLPHLKAASNAHILNLCPPISMQAKWLAPHLAYTLSKYGMSMCVVGMAEEFKPHGIAVNALWPKTVVATAAVKNLLGGAPMVQRSRKPEIVADAAFEILRRRSGECTGQFFLDEEVLRSAGKSDFAEYAVDASAELYKDLFVE